MIVLSKKVKTPEQEHAQHVSDRLRELKSDLKGYGELDSLAQFQKLVKVAWDLYSFSNLIGSDATNVMWANDNRPLLPKTFTKMTKALISVLEVHETMLPFDVDKQRKAQEAQLVQMLSQNGEVPPQSPPQFIG